MDSPLRILYLENDAADAELAQDMLAMDGIVFDVTRVETEAAFRAALQQGGFDLILADYGLPSFDGLSALRITREQGPDRPFIFVSGTIGEEVAIDALKIGATDYVLKTRLSRLVPAVRRALRETEERAELRRSEEALRRSESYLVQAQRLAHIGSWAWEVGERKVLYLSEEWYRIYGFDPKDGMPTWEQVLRRVHPEDQAKFQATVDRAIAEKSDYDVEFRILPPHSPGRYIHSVGRPVLDPSGELLQFVGVSMDITESKQAEEEHERLRQALADLAYLNRVSTMGELTASLAHEIKQPIGAAVTNAEACFRLLDRDQPDFPEAQKAALEMVRDARRAADIIDRVRSLYRKGSSELEAVDVNEVIGEMVFMLHNEANRHSVAIHTDLAEGLPKVMADRVQLQQALMNLMLNGIESIRDTRGELSIKVQLAGDGQLLISVTDTGMGLPTDNIEKIFDAFFTTKAQGTGLGLTITRSIIASHGGRIWATRNAGGGATFHFTLPSRVALSA